MRGTSDSRVSTPFHFINAHRREQVGLKNKITMKKRMKISYLVNRGAVKGARGACFARCCISFATLAMGEV